MKLELTKEEVQYILNAIDSYVRTNGVQVAAKGIAIIEKIREEQSFPGAEK